MTWPLLEVTIKKDKLGRRYCIDQGKRVKCPPTAAGPTKIKPTPTPAPSPEPPAPAAEPVRYGVGGWKGTPAPSAEIPRHLKVGTPFEDSIIGKIEAGTRTSGLSLKPEGRMVKTAVAAVLKNMSTEAKVRVERNMKDFGVYTSSQTLVEQTFSAAELKAARASKGILSRIKSALTPDSVFKQAARELADAVLESGMEVAGSYSPASGTIRLDGLGAYARLAEMWKGKPEGRGIKGPEDVARHTLAHEFGHAIDGPDKRGNSLSGEPAWVEAFRAEIRGGFGEPARLTEYARSTTEEGFAEFARLVYCGDFSGKEIREKFPRCAEFFYRGGLWPYDF